MESSPVTGSDPMVNVRGVTKVYRRGGQDVRVLDNVDLVVAHGDFRSIVRRERLGQRSHMQRHRRKGLFR